MTAASVGSRRSTTGERMHHLECPFCERRFDARQFACLTLFGFAGAVKSGGVWRAVELRRCNCGDVIGLEVDLPMAIRPAPRCTYEGCTAPALNASPDCAEIRIPPVDRRGKCRSMFPTST